MTRQSSKDNELKAFTEESDTGENSSKYEIVNEKQKRSKSKKKLSISSSSSSSSSD